MSQDDDATIERVARAICEATSGPFEMLDDVGRDALRCEARAAITALPERELLAEALEALDRIVDFHIGDCPMTMEEIDFAKNINWQIRKTARAAADKIRAALEQQKAPDHG